MTSHSFEEPMAEELSELAICLEDEYRGSGRQWSGSPFAWIRGESSRRKGKIGEQMVERWCQHLGLTTWAPGDSDCDLVIDGVRVEVKFSTLWDNGTFVFQQIRDQDYAIVVCLGVEPFSAYMWAIPKSVLQDQPQGVTPQHGGARGTDTLWLRIDPENLPAWMGEWGGTLGQGSDSLRELLRDLR